MCLPVSMPPFVWMILYDHDHHRHHHHRRRRPSDPAHFPFIFMFGNNKQGVFFPLFCLQLSSDFPKRRGLTQSVPTDEQIFIFSSPPAVSQSLWTECRLEVHPGR